MNKKQVRFVHERTDEIYEHLKALLDKTCGGEWDAQALPAILIWDNLSLAMHHLVTAMGIAQCVWESYGEKENIEND